jgi:hypothetical protein
MTDSVGLPGALDDSAVTPVRKWWIAERAARPLDLFRIIAAAMLAVHFALHLVQTAPLLAHPALIGPTRFDGFLGSRESWLTDLPLWAVRSAFAVAIAASLAAAAGMAPRVCSALVHVIALSTYWAMAPFAGIDDVVVNVASLFLVLMPVGRTRRLLSAGNAGPARERVPALSVCVFLVAVSLFYLDRGLGALLPQGSSLGGVLVLAVAAIPVAYVLPWTGLRLCGVALQLGLHGWLVVNTHVVVANAILAATAILFWGEVAAPEPRPTVLDAGGAASIVLALIGSVVLATAFLQKQLPTVPAARFLADAGVLPVALNPPSEGSHSLRVKTPERVVPYAMPGRLGDAFLSSISLEQHSPEARLELAEALARRFCRKQGYWGQTGTLELISTGREKRIADFECGKAGTLSHLR